MPIKYPQSPTGLCQSVSLYIFILRAKMARAEIVYPDLHLLSDRLATDGC